MVALRRLTFADARAKRGHYWGVLIALMFINAVVYFALLMNAVANSTNAPLPLLLAVPIISLYPWFTVCTARLRDMGRSSWWSVGTLIPFIGWGVTLWLGFAGSEQKGGEQT